MNKIFAYLLLLAGLMMMFFACIGMYKVFIDKNPVMPVVQMADANISTQYGVVKFPMQAVNQIANLGLFSLLMMQSLRRKTFMPIDAAGISSEISFPTMRHSSGANPTAFATSR